MTLDDFPQMTECCNLHDTCYEKCGANKKLCDDELKTCTHDMCMTAAQQDAQIDEEGLKGKVQTLLMDYHSKAFSNNLSSRSNQPTSHMIASVQYNAIPR